ncbi:hypothetical protein OH807_02970 [Kitasatospora sp. NBC_01560]|uniref:hypothetical protein n=1 Tax=Kitasatospora sp. NBC_01560 TaxID=2975965 RepID=UPI003865C1A8
MSPAGELLALVTAVPALSACAAALACWPLRDGPLAPRLLVFALIIAAGVVAGLPACFGRLSAPGSD